MATSTFNYGAGSTNYTGEVLGDLITLTAQENETYKEGLIHVKSGIQKKYTLPGIKLGGTIQDHAATPTSSRGTYELSERYLEPEDFMIYFEFNPRDFEQYYKPFQPTGNLIFRTLDPKVQSVILRLLMESQQEYIGQSIWCAAKPEDAKKIASADGSVQAGKTEIGGNYGEDPMKYFNGAIARILKNAVAPADSEDAKSGKVNVVGSGSFADGEAVETELFKMWEATAPKIRKKQGLVILMDYDSWDKYNRYMASKTYKYSDNTKENEHRFQGKRIIPMVALPESTIIMGVFTTGIDSNLWMGVDYTNDEDVLQVEKLQANSELYFCKILMKMDINILRPSEITVHIPFTYTA